MTNPLNSHVFHPQGLISRTKDFGAADESLRSKLSALQLQLVAADSLQPDILAKKSQADRFMVRAIQDQTQTASASVRTQDARHGYSRLPQKNTCSCIGNVTFYKARPKSVMEMCLHSWIH